MNIYYWIETTNKRQTFAFQRHENKNQRTPAKLNQAIKGHQKIKANWYRIIKKKIIILIIRLLHNQCLNEKIQNVPRTSTHFEDYKELDHNFLNWKEVKIKIFGLNDIKDTKPSFVKIKEGYI